MPKRGHLGRVCGRGEIGKHSRLKICRPSGLAGSSPAVRTIMFPSYD